MFYSVGGWFLPDTSDAFMLFYGSMVIVSFVFYVKAGKTSEGSVVRESAMIVKYIVFLGGLTILFLIALAYLARFL